jgi:hypothetical protein
MFGLSAAKINYKRQEHLSKQYDLTQVLSGSLVSFLKHYRRHYEK